MVSFGFRGIFSEPLQTTASEQLFWKLLQNHMIKMKQIYPKLVQYISRQMLQLYLKNNKFIWTSLHYISLVKTSLNKITKL